MSETTRTMTTKVSVLCSLLTWIQKSKSSAKKRSKFRKYIENFCKPHDYYSSIRLILPNLDRERGTYGLKESVLATCLIDALGISRLSPDALRLINWRKGGPNNGINVGNFALLATEILQRRQGMSSGELAIKELNDLLDRLASSENRADKISVLSTLISKTNAQEMKWIVMIILKDLKLGISEKTIFHEFHPDAEDLFNVTCDLKFVCEKLSNRTQRHKRQDIEVGKPVRPQLAMRVANANVAWKRLVGKEVVVESKFDGDRIQIHKNGTEIHYFSRNFLDHPEYGHAMSNVIIENILVDKCILDGEMLVWDSSLNRFAEFGSNQEIAKAAKEGLDSDRQICYVAFDVLYVGDTSVIHQTLKERHELLHKLVNPLKGRLELLVPKDGLNAHRSSGEPRWSLIVHNVEEIERFFKETVDNREEGIVLKDLGSKWEPSDRSGKWLKLKPDYIHPGSDLDVLIIGGYYGSGRHGGEVAQFLVGLAEDTAPGTYPRKFISFCRVGTGLSDVQLDAVVSKLKPFFKKYEYPKKPPPRYYQVTNNSKERPDVWIDSPEKSIILSITSDIRTIRSGVFAAPYSLRFPRIDQVRYDKPWFECLDVKSFIELVGSGNGSTQRGADYEGQQNIQPRSRKFSKKVEKKSVDVVPSQFVQTDVSTIKGETLIFSNMMFFFVNVPKTHSLDTLHKLVAENGGTFSMNLNNSVTHCVAADGKGIKFQAARRCGDIIHCSWVLDSCREKKLQALHPKYFLYLSECTKSKLQQDIDVFSDSYYQNIDIVDMKNLLKNIDRHEDSQTIDYYKKKYCPKIEWGRFHNCCIFFLLPLESIYAGWEAVLELALRRMKLEVAMGGGKISNDLSRTTHLVVLSLPEILLNLDAILNSFSTAEKRILCNKRLHVVGSKWFEDCLEQGIKVQEDAYCLKPDCLEFANSIEYKSGIDLEANSGLDSIAKPKMPLPSNIEEKQTRGKSDPDREGKRKRGRPTGKMVKHGSAPVTEAQRIRARIGKRPAKISDSHVSSEAEKSEEEDETESRGGNFVSHDSVIKDEKYGIKEEAEGTAEHREVGGKSEMLEVMDDPVQAMLLEMIPSLGIKNVVTSYKSVVETEKQSLDDNEEQNPIKKKKVSYKDIAAELLKEW